MTMKSMAVTLWILILTENCLAKIPFKIKKFPDDFTFGAATASYQIEGGWNADDKGENIWDRLTHTHPELFNNGSTGDITDDSYHNYKRDVQMMRELGLNTYRFSLSWTRILPTAGAKNISKAGVAFYNNYINEMLKYNITPTVTLYHWDLPQTLQDLGGFFNPQISDWFKEYARVAFTLFGDRVKRWLTFNEPKSICLIAVYFSKDNSTRKGLGEYLCAKNMAVAHANTYHMYVNEFKGKQKGHVGLTCDIDWFGSLTNSKEDRAAAKLRRQAEWGVYINPIFSKEGGFPKELSVKVAAKSLQQGYNTSRMPAFTAEEKAFVRGTYDFFGMNHYTGVLVSATKYRTLNPVPSVEDDIDVGSYVPEDWPRSAASWLIQAPNSIYNAIMTVKQEYTHLDTHFYIFENGWSTAPTAGLYDTDRVRYYRASLRSLLDVMAHGVKVKGFTVWSLMDNFEWLEGYNRFGLYQVNFDDPARPRTPRLSAFFYKDIIKKRYIDYDFHVDINNATL